MKILVDAKTDTVIGGHMIGPDCAEIMQVCGLCLTAHFKLSETFRKRTTSKGAA